MFLACLGVLPLCLLGLISPSTQSPPGYVYEHNNYVYKVVFPEDDKRTWNEAESLCQTSEGGHLTSLVTPSEISWVDGVIKQIVQDAGLKVKLWIGGSDRKIHDVWDFVDGQPLRYNVAPWAPGYPKRPDQHATYEYCVSLEFEGHRSIWYVEDCYEAYGYICKADGPSRRLTEKRFGYSWEWEQHVYKFIPLQLDGLSWTEAEIYCKAVEGGHLLSLRHPKENRWVTERIRQIRWVVGFSKFWIGASDIKDEGTFRWSDDSTNPAVNYTRWAVGQPSTVDNRRRKEHCVAINADPNWGKWSDERCVIATPFACKSRVCLGEAEIAFLVDSSGASGEDFQEVKNFVWSVIENYEISNNGTRVGLIRFSTEASVIFDFQDSADNAIRLKEMIDNVILAEGSDHKTERGLQLARTDLFSAKGGSRLAVPKILVAMTQGSSESLLAVARASMALKRNHVTIVVVGIGEEVNIEELLTMASTTDNLISVRTFKELKKGIVIVRDKVCGEMIEHQRRLREAQEST
ncbi:macrophage mannose receptor 1-like [Montipora capricornis]|uniref:macrophage mannose receptor 1-like n=1 Tax=Montipora capricornis TaxID=246305 RepID=UPI0035F1170E